VARGAGIEHDEIDRIASAFEHEQAEAASALVA
jgi:hypothetical protein